jgi:hypothetical protein
MGMAQATSTKTPKIIFPNIAPNLAAASVMDIAVDLHKKFIDFLRIIELQYLGILPDVCWKQFRTQTV